MELSDNAVLTERAALDSGALLSLHRVTRRFPRGAESVLALADVSTTIYAGELTVAAGPSGSGKTTMMSIMCGVEQPDDGEVVSHPPLPPVPGWRHLGFVPQALGLLDELSIIENINLPAVLDPTADQADGANPDRAGASIGELLERLEIKHLADRYPSHTSGGEQQRAAIARALRLRPILLLADEPTGHQDRARVQLVLTVLREHAYNGAAVLLSSHDPEVIEAADRVITLADGRIVSDTRTEVSRTI